jgi:hypothetical protein
MKKFSSLVLLTGLAAWPGLLLAAGGPLTVKAVNKLPLARGSQTIELAAKALAPLGTNLSLIRVTDATGKELLCQAVDTDYDDFHRPDIVIFQSDFAPNETKSFTVTTGRARPYTKDDFKAHGRFVRERFDDFAWENDRIAHRAYGKALETWKGEPLTSSGIDIWSKRTTRMVVDEWYMVDDYHADAGEGCDDYSVGASRGCAGTGIWLDNKLNVSRNFVDSRVLANGPIRVMFELVYPAFDAGNLKVTEARRISLDAGSQLDHFQSLYTFNGSAPGALCGIGLKKARGAEKTFNADHAWLATWEPMEKNMGMHGLGLIVDPKSLDHSAEDAQNYLLLLKQPAVNVPVSCWAGFAWDRAGKITSADAWKKYMDEFSQGIASPIEVTVSGQ